MIDEAPFWNIKEWQDMPVSHKDVCFQKNEASEKFTLVLNSLSKDSSEFGTVYQIVLFRLRQTLSWMQIMWDNSDLLIGL